MIIHRLIAHHLFNRDDPRFYTMQARDALRWIRKGGVVLNEQITALDLGAGHGIFGSELQKYGCDVVFADESNFLMPDLSGASFFEINLDQDDITGLGVYDLVICSNVLEHLSKPFDFLAAAGKLLKPNGVLYLSWTNWLSPWGGHEFSPFHYFGSRWGHRIYDKLKKRPRLHTPFVNLFPTYISEILAFIHRESGLRILRAAPRYYPELAFLVHVPALREFFTWNCALLIQNTESKNC
ncbi:MAG: class I SAM-dependent methyltransferase [Verrucomicrobia bacterium]|nr:class I SAM-dependent methyltransferase [Verrucomicrobiota bacterium]